MTLTIIPFLPFELGNSVLAGGAVENYEKYNKIGEYSFLKKCFAYLHLLVSETPQKKIVATKACEALARSTFDFYKSIYVKFFIANSVDSIHVNAQIEVDPYWIEQSSLMMKLMKEEGIDFIQAKEAGVALVNRESIEPNNFVFRG